MPDANRLLGPDQFIPTKAIAVDISAVDADLATLISPFARRIYVGGGGDVIVRYAGAPATSITYKNVPAGTWLTGAFTTVMRIGTTATLMIAEQ